MERPEAPTPSVARVPRDWCPNTSSSWYVVATVAYSLHCQLRLDIVAELCLLVTVRFKSTHVTSTQQSWDVRTYVVIIGTPRRLVEEDCADEGKLTLLFED